MTRARKSPVGRKVTVSGAPAATSSNASLPKVPRVVPDDLDISDDELVLLSNVVLWRVHATTGDHPYGWDEMRHFGPVPSMRFDPHPEPMQEWPNHSVMYAALDPVTALAEVYQDTRVIQRSRNGNKLSAWKPARPLNLLNLSSNWPLRNGAAASMQMDDKQNTRAWAHAIEAQLGSQIDGLYHLSSLNSRPMMTLFHRAKGSFPRRARYSELLTSAAADAVLVKAAKQTRYGVEP